MHTAEIRNVTGRPGRKPSLMLAAEAIRPEAAKPMAVEPNELMAISELAAANSSSEATSGSTLSCAGSKNCPMALVSMTITYSQTTLNGDQERDQEDQHGAQISRTRS